MRSLSRADILAGAGAMLATILAGASPATAKVRMLGGDGNLVITYADGVGLLNAKGQTLVRLHINFAAQTMYMDGEVGTSATLPLKPTPNTPYQIYPGYYLQVDGNGNAAINGGTLSVSQPALVSSTQAFGQDVTLVSPVYKILIKQCQKPPCQQITTDCVVAMLDFALATAALFVTGAALFIPGVDVVDLIAYTAAMNAFIKAGLDDEYACGL
jgi:hypothetical protein